MKNKLSIKILILTIFILAFASNVYAAIDLNSIFSPFANIDFADFYLRFYKFIDAVIFLIFFLGITKFVFKPLYDKDKVKTSKPISIGISLALTFSMVVMEQKTDFNLSKLGPIAAMVFFLVLAIMLYNVIKSLLEDVGSSAALTFLIMYGLLVSTFKDLHRWIEQNVPILASLLALFTIIAFILLIIRAIQLIPRGGNTTPTGTPPGTTPPPAGTPPETTPPAPAGNNMLVIDSPRNGDRLPENGVQVSFRVAGPGFQGFFSTYNYTVRDERNNTLFQGRSRHGAMNLGNVPFGMNPGRRVIQVTVIPKNGGPLTERVEFEVVPRGGGGTPPTDTIDEFIDRLEANNNNFVLHSRNYANLFIRIINMNNAYRTGRGLFPGIGLWTALANERGEMMSAANIVNNTINAIRGHPGFAGLSGPLLNAFNAQTARFAGIQIHMIRFEFSARDDFNNNRPAGRGTVAP